MDESPLTISLRPGNPGFLSLPWRLPLDEWKNEQVQLEELPRGLSRHPVVFVSEEKTLFAFKELPPGLAEKEYNMLMIMEALRLPVVTPVGHASTHNGGRPFSILITRYLEHSLPYRMLFMRSGLERYRAHLLDAIAGLLVQLHLVGIYWGDCSFSNTLFRRDAGALQAYLVDAETAEFHMDHLPPVLRHQDLEIMEENVNGELADLKAQGLLAGLIPEIPLRDTGAYIRVRYQRLWEEITHEDIITPGEHYRIQERIRALNRLGYSVGEVELTSGEGGSHLHLRAVVTDRNFHRDQLYSLTGLEAEEGQARQMMNEILEVQATLARQNNRSTPLSVAAQHWVQYIYQPTIEHLKALADNQNDPVELYCQLLEHKWYLSEKAQHDVGHQAALEDFIRYYRRAEGQG